LHGPCKNITDLQYGSFDILEKVGDNDYRLNIPPHMLVYSVVNVKNIKLYDCSMLGQEEENALPSIED
jgi:hypothetical protein